MEISYHISRKFISQYESVFHFDERSIRVFKYQYKKFLYRYHDAQNHINIIDQSINHGSTNSN